MTESQKKLMAAVGIAIVLFGGGLVLLSQDNQEALKGALQSIYIAIFGPPDANTPRDGEGESGSDRNENGNTTPDAVSPDSSESSPPEMPSGGGQVLLFNLGDGEVRGKETHVWIGSGTWVVTWERPAGERYQVSQEFDGAVVSKGVVPLDGMIQFGAQGPGRLFYIPTGG